MLGSQDYHKRFGDASINTSSSSLRLSSVVTTISDDKTRTQVIEAGAINPDSGITFN